MIRSEPKFVTNERALVAGRTLVIADLHIGLEHELRNSGVAIPPQTKRTLERILDLVKMTRAKELVLLGDIKHRITGLSSQEARELPSFFASLSKKVRLTVVPGNHDGLISQVCPPKTRIVGASGISLGNVYACHGHAWPSEEALDCDYLVISHNHPAIEIKDKIGFRFVEPAWIIGTVDRKKLKKALKPGRSPKRKAGETVKVNTLRIIIIPAFNTLLAGTPFNTKEGRRLGPVVGLMERPEAIMLDGTYLGRTEKLIQ